MKQSLLKLWYATKERQPIRAPKSRQQVKAKMKKVNPSFMVGINPNTQRWDLPSLPPPPPPTTWKNNYN